MKKESGLAVVLSDEQAAALRAEFPAEASFNRILLPRLGMVSQDKFEGKGKAAKLVAEAGMFYTERQSDEVDENGKKVWDRTDLGLDIEGIIIFQRKQLRYYDEGTQEFTSSPIYDSNEEMVPLFKNKVKIATDTPTELKKLYPGLTRAGKPTSKLSEDRILYVLASFAANDEPEVFQLNLHGTSMYSFLDYSRKHVVPTVLTKFGSEPKENGATQWNQMTFEPVRKITPEEAMVVLEKVRQIKDGIAAERAFYGQNEATLPSSDRTATVSAAMTKAVKEFDK